MGSIVFRFFGILRGLKRSQHTNKHNKTLKGKSNVRFAQLWRNGIILIQRLVTIVV